MNPSAESGAGAGHNLTITLSAEFCCPGQVFRTTVRGVTKRNPDGSERQNLIKTLVPGQALTLLREPSNQYDKYAVAVLKVSGEQLGYVPAGDKRLADHIDMGGSVTAKVVTITGGPGILGLFFRSLRKPYGCVIEIQKGGFDNWKAIAPYMNKSREIETLISTAHKLEENDEATAISMYRDAVKQIVALDELGSVAAAWRRARYPINRLSLLLDRSGLTQEAYEEIVRYEQFHDVFGLTQEDEKSVAARKQRLSKKLAVSNMSSVKPR